MGVVCLYLEAAAGAYEKKLPNFCTWLPTEMLQEGAWTLSLLPLLSCLVTLLPCELESNGRGLEEK